VRSGTRRSTDQANWDPPSFLALFRTQAANLGAHQEDDKPPSLLLFKKTGGRETAAHGRQWSAEPRSLSLPESRDDLGHGGVDLWVLLGGGLCLLANIDIGA
jgi:hypothetical protein